VDASTPSALPLSQTHSGPGGRTLATEWSPLASEPRNETTEANPFAAMAGLLLDLQRFNGRSRETTMDILAPNHTTIQNLQQLENLLSLSNVGLDISYTIEYPSDTS